MNVPEPDSDRFEALDPAPFRAELQALYAALESEVREAGPTCELSGRCCRFADYDHTLFLSAAEFAVLLSDAPEAVRPVDDGATCPWQDVRGRCNARTARPLGCRVYYCEPSYQDRGQELSEQYLARLRDLTNRHGLPWNYAPLHHHLRRAVAAGRLPEAPDGPNGGRFPTAASAV